MAKFPALPLWTDSYLADTRHLTAAQHGAYLILLMMAWRLPDCALPNDDAKLARWIGLDNRNWQKMKPIIMDFWSLDEDQLWRQKRLTSERKYADSVSKRNSLSGQASALKRKETTSTTVQPLFNDFSTPIPIPIPKPIREEKKDTKVSTKKAASSEANLLIFEEWWKLVPKRVAKHEARKAFDRALTKTDIETITTGTMRWAQESTGKESQFIKHPATWLNQGCWEDDPQPTLGINHENNRRSPTSYVQPARQPTTDDIAEDIILRKYQLGKYGPSQTG